MVTEYILVGSDSFSSLPSLPAPLPLPPPPPMVGSGSMSVSSGPNMIGLCPCARTAVWGLNSDPCREGSLEQCRTNIPPSSPPSPPPSPPLPPPPSLPEVRSPLSPVVRPLAGLDTDCPLLLSPPSSSLLLPLLLLLSFSSSFPTRVCPR